MRQFRWLSAIGRARAGVPLEQARAAVHASAAALEAAWPKENAHLGVTTEPLADAIFGEIRAPLAALLGAAAFVLLIGCLNVANLLLARGSSRSREMAVRLALGATRGALVRQLLVESAVLVALGAAGGVFIAMALVPALASAASAEVASFVRFRIDTMVLTAVLFVAAGSALIFGLAPAVAASGVSPVDGLRESGRSATAFTKPAPRRGASSTACETAA